MDISTFRPLLLVINPVAGRQLGKKYLTDILSVFTNHEFLTTVYVTQARGDATRFVAARGKDFKRIVCIGGDGTLNETVTGMMQGDIACPLGYIPAGSTNVFADSHSLPEHPIQAAEIAASDHIRLFDLGQYENSYFSYVAAFGMFTCLSFTTPQALKNKLGHTAYILDGIRDLAQTRPTHACFTADNITHEGDYLFGAVCNATSLARTFTFPKDTVDMADGQFEVILISEPATPIELQETITALRTQNYAASRQIDFFHANRLCVTCSSTLEWTLDGEPKSGLSQIEIKCLPRTLQLICPES